MLKPKTIVIEIIPHNDQRYETCGDWYIEGDILHVKISALSDWKRTMLIALHELVEYVLCNEAGVTQEAVDAFDFQYEEDRLPDDDSEPGDYALAPYRSQHCLATGVERILASVLNVQWSDYEDEINSLSQKKEEIQAHPHLV